MSDSVDVGGPTAAVLREAMGRTQRAAETDAIDDISASFNYDSKVRSAPGKLWVEHYPGWLWVYAHFMIDRNTRVRELCSGGTRLLDVGCGMGDLLYLLRDGYERLVGIDPSEAMARQATENMFLLGLADRCSITRELAESLDFEDESFDTVLMLDVYEHIRPELRLRALSEARRVLRRGGELLLATPSRAELLAWSLFDRLCDVPRRLIRLRRIGRLWGLEQRSFTEEFCSKAELLDDICRAELKVVRFERVGFYPAAEEPGTFGRLLYATRGIPGLHGAIRASFRVLSLVPLLNQKMLVRCVK